MKTVTFGHRDQTQFPNAMKKDIEVKSILESGCRNSYLG